MGVLHVFDMDGTLLRGTTASLEIARSLGCEGELKALEQHFAAGRIDTRDFAVRIHQMWKCLTPDRVADVAVAAPWIRGLPDVLKDIRSRGEWSLVVTMSPDFFATHLLTMGADTVRASRFPTLPFREEINVANILAPADKVAIVDQALSGYGVDRTRCIAYGDSASDIPLFQALACTVSVNGDAHIAPWSRLFYEGEDLREAYRLARAHFIVDDRSPLSGPASV